MIYDLGLLALGGAIGATGALATVLLDATRAQRRQVQEVEK